jgi:hypothetical protein
MKGVGFKSGAGMIQFVFLPVPVLAPGPGPELEPEPEPEPPVPGLGAVLAPLALGRSRAYRTASLVCLRLTVMETATHHQLETHRMFHLFRGELYPVHLRKVHPWGWVLSRGRNMG